MWSLSTIIYLSYIISQSTKSSRIGEYHFETNSLNWADAKVFCDEHYDGLATIISVDDLSAATFTIPTIIGNAIHRVWIGLNDIQQEAQWKWSHGEACQFNNTTGGHDCSDLWYTGEPNDDNNNEDCGEIWWRDGHWVLNDDTCDESKSFLCNIIPQYKYIYNGTFLNWTDSEASCNKYYGGMATIQTTQDLINAISVIPGGVDDVWIGLNDFKAEGQWEWSNGDPCIKNISHRDTLNISHDCSTFWSEGQPDDWRTGEDCGEMWFYRDTGTWMFNDLECSHTHASLCIQSNTPHPTVQPTPVIQNNHFVLSLQQRTWAQSMLYCQQHYNGLAAVNENNLQQVIELFPNNIDVMDVRHAWIGLNDLKHEGVWEWSDGSECILNNANCTELWNKGEPNNNYPNEPEGEDCGELKWVKKLSQWKINDKFCDYTYAALCSKNETSLDPTQYPSLSPSVKPSNMPTLKPTWKPTPLPTAPTLKPTYGPQNIRYVNRTVYNNKQNNSSTTSILDIVLMGVIIVLVIALCGTLFCLLKFKQMYKRVDEMSEYVSNTGNAGKNDDFDVRFVGDDQRMATTIN